MIFLAFAYAALMLLAFGLGLRSWRKAGAVGMLIFLGADSLLNFVAYWLGFHHHGNQWAANLGTLAAAGALLPALAAWCAPSLGQLLRGLALVLVLGWGIYFAFLGIGLKDSVAAPIVGLALVLAAGLAVASLARQEAALWSRMPFWMAAGVLLAFGTDLIPWALSERVAKVDMLLHGQLWTLRNAAWTVGACCFIYGWGQE